MNVKFMSDAIALAKQAAKEGEIPVGCVIVKDGAVIGKGYNRREKEKNPLSHAETEAIADASKTLGDWRLDGCELYVTLEPCPMCAGAIINSRISEVVFGAYDSRMGSCAAESVVNLFSLGYDCSIKTYGGICESECGELLTEFFKTRR